MAAAAGAMPPPGPPGDDDPRPPTDKQDAPQSDDEADKQLSGDTCPKCGQYKELSSFINPKRPTKKLVKCSDCRDGIKNKTQSDTTSSVQHLPPSSDEEPAPKKRKLSSNATQELKLTTALPKCDGCGGEGYRRREHAGPGDTRLCSTCFRKNKYKISTGPKECDQCGMDRGRTSRTYRGPNNTRICGACTDANKKAGTVVPKPPPSKATKASELPKQPPSKATKASELPKQPPSKATLGIPARTPVTSLRDESYQSIEQLDRLAIAHWRRLNPEFSPFRNDCRPPISSEYYWSLGIQDVRTRCRARGILIDQNRKHELINVLMLADALNGIRPAPPQFNATRYHYMRSADLMRLATQRGAPSHETLRQRAKKLPRLKIMEEESDGSQDEMHDDDDENVVDDPSAQNAAPLDVDEHMRVDAPLYIQWLIDDDIANDRNAWSNIDEAATMETVREILRDMSIVLGNSPEAQAAFNRARLSSLGAAPGTLAETRNQGLRGPPALLSNLDQVIWRNDFPTHTSSIGYLCGPNGLVITLNSERHHGLQMVPGRWANTRQFDRAVMLGLLFTNYREGMDVQPNDVGVPTDLYRNYIEQTFGHLRQSDEHAYSDLWMQMIQLNNLSANQLQAILTLLHQQGLVPHHYQLGVVASAHPVIQNGAEVWQPATATTTGDYDPTRPVAWLHNNVAFGGGEYNHWEGFDGTGGRNIVNSWGLVTGDAGAMPRQPFNRFDPHNAATTTAESEARNAARNAKNREGQARRRLEKKCIGCRENNRPCDGRPGTACTACTSSKEDCIWPPHLPRLGKLMKLSEVTMNDVEPWDTPDFDREERIKLAAEAKWEELPTDKPYFVCISVARKSGGSLADIPHLLQICAQNRHHYNVLLNDPNYANVAVGQRPGGANTLMRSFLLPLVRHGGKMIPSRLGNLQDPFLMAFVQLIHTLCSPATVNKPLEIHIVTSGLAGFSVGPDRWQGLFDFITAQDQLHGTNIASTVHIVPVVEPRVVTGINPESLHHPNQSPGWVGYKHKYLEKLSLSTVLSRNTALLHQRVFGGPPPPGGFPFEDDYCAATKDESDWRGNQLDATTNPTDATVQARNTNRNTPLHP